ncbi:hypothetical protein PISMIDRAFT_680600 [Pisolithus microcarpus 441]|uniref:Uncharacterized protein n=1 Tax=Pisolithus microcarpus 441 TaxID=765257 RepID=A0A0C9YBI0_9AGAM|nr:hypothetical protein BKA83DRAFT_680600 [Pisolithus microcarpus]KIK22090.1 hypothetical protein PISMIDRAFT_680600 [Pisolithus microcarpus 441]
MSPPPFLGNAPPGRSTVQHTRDLTLEGGRHFEHRYHTAASACRSATVDAQESQYLEPSSGDDCDVSISEVLQLSSCPIISTPQVLAGSSNLVGHLSGESDSVRVALLLGYVAGQNRASSIDSPLVDHACGNWDVQGHVSDYIMNHDTTLPPSYTKQIRSRTPFPYAYPIPPLPNSTSCSTSDGYIPSCSSFPMSNQNPPSWSPQEHLGYPLPIHPHCVRPIDLPGFRGFDTGSKMEMHASGILDNHAAQVLGDHPSHTLSDHKTHSFCNYTTHIPDDHTAGGGVDNYGIFDESRFNSEQVVGLRPHLPLPPNQLTLSPRKLHSHHRVSPIRSRTHSGTFCHTRCCATAQPRLTTRPPGICCRNASRPCGWRDDTGRECGMLVNCGNRKDHFAAAHGIENMAEHVKILCHWCHAEPQTVVIRKNFSRHVKEVHLGCPRR